MDTKSMDTKSSDSSSLEDQIATTRKSLFLEAILTEQFTRLETMEDDKDPNFVDKIASTYLSQTPIDIYAIEQVLYAIPVDPARVDTLLYKLKGASTSFGANKMIIEINKIIDCFRGGDLEGCRAGLPILKQEFDTLKNKLGAYLKLLRQDTPSSSCCGNY